MKFFNLKSKFSLIFWSIFFGAFLEHISFILSSQKHTIDGPPFYWTGGFPILYCDFGGEFNGPIDFYKYFLNLFLYVLVAFILLLIVRKIKK